MKFVFFIFWGAFSLAGCAGNEKPQEKAFPAEQMQKEVAQQVVSTDEKKAAAIANAIRTYDIKYCWDSINSLKFNNYRDIGGSGYTLITDYDLVYVQDHDSVFHMVLSCGNMREFFLKLDIQKGPLTKGIVAFNDAAGTTIPGYPAIVVRLDNFNIDLRTGNGEIIALLR